MLTKAVGQMIPVSMAAGVLGVSRQRVYELIRTGRLGWVKMEKTVMVNAKSVDDYLSDRRKRNES